MNDGHMCGLAANGAVTGGASRHLLQPVPGNLRFFQMLPGQSYDFSSGGLLRRDFACGITTQSDLYC